MIELSEPSRRLSQGYNDIESNLSREVGSATQSHAKMSSSRAGNWNSIHILGLKHFGWSKVVSLIPCHFFHFFAAFLELPNKPHTMECTITLRNIL